MEDLRAFSILWSQEQNEKALNWEAGTYLVSMGNIVRGSLTVEAQGLVLENSILGTGKVSGGKIEQALLEARVSDSNKA